VNAEISANEMKENDGGSVEDQNGGQAAGTFDSTRFVFEVEWNKALDALMGYQAEGLGHIDTGLHDLKPLAAMLRSRSPVPISVAEAIADLLDPTPESWGGRLEYRPPQERAVNFWKDRGEKLEARDMYRELRRGGASHKVAVYKASQTFGRSERWVMDTLSLNFHRIFAEAKKRLNMRGHF
jgi:hypothetical protein